VKTAFQIFNGVNNWGTITDFSYYCIDNELKRAISNLQSTIRKKQDIGEPPLKKVSRTGFSVGKSQSKSKRRARRRTPARNGGKVTRKSKKSKKSKKSRKSRKKM